MSSTPEPKEAREFTSRLDAIAFLSEMTTEPASIIILTPPPPPRQ